MVDVSFTGCLRDGSHSDEVSSSTESSSGEFVAAPEAVAPAEVYSVIPGRKFLDAWQPDFVHIIFEKVWAILLADTYFVS